MDLAGRGVIVTGGRRVGRAVAAALVARGANLILPYRHSRAEAEETAALAQQRGCRAVTLQADLSRWADAERVIATAISQVGNVDALVHLASTYQRTPLHALDERHWSDSLAANATTAYNCAVLAGREMVRGAGGRIVLVSDWAVHRPYLDYIPYFAAKGAVEALTRALAVELAPKVQVNCIAPGPVLLPTDVGERERQSITRKTLLQRLGTPDDIAAAVVYLLEGGDYVTGTILPVDGGRTLAS